MIGTTVGHFRVVGQLGRGASGTVYEAVDEILDRDVALKVLNPNLVDPEAINRFRTEATTLARLSHPGIATVYELFESDGDLVMAMECVRGETLDRLCDRVGALPPDRAAVLTGGILAALGHAHDAGILHRDMKPANVMVSGDVVKIMDFGIARVLGTERTAHEEGLLGTPGYMAPEQVLGQPLDARTDLYAVGVILYRLLTGTLPFDAEAPIAVLQRQIADPPEPLHRHRAGLPAWCEPVVQRALAKSPAERFQTAKDFRAALGTAPVAGTARPARRVSRGIVEGVALASVAAAVGAIAFGAWHHAVASPLASPPPASPLTATPIAPPLSEVLADVTPAPLPAPAAEQTVAPPAPVSPRVEPRRAFARLAFDAKALVEDGRRQHERDATLVLDGGVIAIVDADGGRPLYIVPYDSVTSIAYSHSRDPLWRSPRGPAPVAHITGGMLRTLGISISRGWVSLRTKTATPFIVLRVDEAQVTKVLLALHERTRLTPERLTPTPVL